MLHSLYTSTSQEQHQSHFGKYQFAFKCYKHSGPDHLCVVSNKKDEDDPLFMDCVKEGNDSVLMKKEHLIWYGKVSVLNFMLSFFFK